MPVPVRVGEETTIVEMADGNGFLPVQSGRHVVVDPEMRVLRRLPIIDTCEEILAAEQHSSE